MISGHPMKTNCVGKIFDFRDLSNETQSMVLNRCCLFDFEVGTAELEICEEHADYLGPGFLHRERDHVKHSKCLHPHHKGNRTRQNNCRRTTLSKSIKLYNDPKNSVWMPFDAIICNSCRTSPKTTKEKDEDQEMASEAFETDLASEVENKQTPTTRSKTKASKVTLSKSISPPMPRSTRLQKKKEAKRDAIASIRKRRADTESSSNGDADSSDLDSRPGTPAKIFISGAASNVTPNAPPPYSEQPPQVRKARRDQSNSTTPRSLRGEKSTPRTLRYIGRQLSFDDEMDDPADVMTNAYEGMTVGENSEGNEYVPQKPEHEGLSKAELERQAKRDALNNFLTTCGQEPNCTYTIGKARKFNGPKPEGISTQSKNDILRVIDNATVAVLDTVSQNKNDHSSIFDAYVQSQRLSKRLKTIVQPKSVKDIIKYHNSVSNPKEKKRALSGRGKIDVKK